MLRLCSLLLCSVAVSVPRAGAAADGPSVSGSWVGSYSLSGPGSVTASFTKRTAIVALGVGHANAQPVTLSVRGSRIRFRLPGRPTPLTFSGRLAGGAIRGTVSQGGASGRFRLHRGSSAAMVSRGYYSSAGRTLAVVDDPFGPERLVDLDTGEVHALFPSGGAFQIGSGFATRDPVSGSARFAYATSSIRGAPATRLPIRQLEVRFPSAGAVISGTLTLPTGSGPHPAVAFVTGSGPTQRAYLPDLAALLVRSGVAVLAYDKRGVGQSTGRYPGEQATSSTIDVLARDAEAAARFLAAQPEIDLARVGLAGHSQAGWIMPLAATREPAIRFLVVFSGPTVTVEQSDYYQSLSGAGVTPQQLSDDEIDARVVAAGPGGVDPLPWISSLHVPVLWLYGGLDMHIPTRLSIKRLEPLLHQNGHDFTIDTYPKANHALVDTLTGLTSEMLKSDTFAPGLFPDVRAWLRLYAGPQRWCVSSGSCSVESASSRRSLLRYRSVPRRLNRRRLCC
jgi:uncharacterized protein